MGSGSWCTHARFNDNHTKEGILGNAPKTKDVPFAPMKQMEFLGKKKSLTSLQTVQYKRGSSSLPLSCTIPRSFNSPAPELKEAPIEETEEFFASLATCSKSRPGISYPWWNCLLYIVYQYTASTGYYSIYKEIQFPPFEIHLVMSSNLTANSFARPAACHGFSPGPGPCNHCHGWHWGGEPTKESLQTVLMANVHWWYLCGEIRIKFTYNHSTSSTVFLEPAYLQAAWFCCLEQTVDLHPLQKDKHLQLYYGMVLHAPSHHSWNRLGRNCEGPEK